MVDLHVKEVDHLWLSMAFHGFPWLSMAAPLKKITTRVNASPEIQQSGAAMPAYAGTLNWMMGKTQKKHCKKPQGGAP